MFQDKHHPNSVNIRYLVLCCLWGLFCFVLFFWLFTLTLEEVNQEVMALSF